MKITDVRSTIVAMPAKRHSSSMSGRNAVTWKIAQETIQFSIIVEVYTDEGIVGLGEPWILINPKVTKMIIDSAKPIILGEDPFDVERIRRMLFDHYMMTHFHLHVASWALSSIEMALWDIVARDCKKPLYKIWGGCFRKKIPFVGWISRGSKESMANDARDYVEQGFKTLFLKVGMDPIQDIEAIRTIREAVDYDGSEIRVDANQAWTPGGAIKIIKKMEKYELEYVEQPVLKFNLEGMARVRKSVDTPILSHESSWTFYETLNVIKREAADAIQLDPRFDAGFMGAKKAAGIAEAAGMPVSTHGTALGISTSAFLHFNASTPNSIIANQPPSSAYLLYDDVITGGPMKIENGYIQIPEGPGLGVELDPEKVEKYSVLYQEYVDKGIIVKAPREDEWEPIDARY